MGTFAPELGVSLHTVTGQLTPAHEGLLEGSTVATIEVLPDSLYPPDRRDEGFALLRRVLAGTDVRVATVHCPFGGSLDLSSPDPDVRGAGRTELADSMALAAELGAGMVVVHASAEPIEDAERPARRAVARKSLQRAADACRGAGTRVAVELLPRTCLGNSVADLLALLDGLDPAIFGVCLDVNHLMDRYRELPGAVGDLGDRLLTLHLSDYDGVDEKHWMPGQGVIDWAAFTAALGAIAYAGPFNYEAHPEGDTPETRLRDLAANFTWLAGLAGG